MNGYLPQPSVSLFLSLQYTLAEPSGRFLPSAPFSVPFLPIPFASGPVPDHGTLELCRRELVFLIAKKNLTSGILGRWW